MNTPSASAKPPFDDLPRPCPACGASFEPWNAGEVECARCSSCRSVLLDAEQLEPFAQGVAELAGSTDTSSGKGHLREGESCPCGEPLRLGVERAWLCCDRCKRVLLAWSDVLEIAGKPEVADVDWGMLALAESDLPPTTWLTDARGRAAVFILGGLFLIVMGALMSHRDVLIAGNTQSVADREAAAGWWRLVLDGELGIVLGVLSVLGGIATLVLASVASKSK